MHRPLFLSLLLAVPLALNAQAPPGVQDQPAAIIQPIPADQAASKRIILPGDIMVAQIANGELAGGQIFFMIFEVMSLIGEPASFEVRFWDPDGNAMSLPLFTGIKGEKGVSGVGLQGTVPARGGGAQITSPTGAPVQVGYATVESTPPNSVAVTAIFNNQVPGERLYQASIPQDTVLHDRMTMPYINGGGYVTSFALVSALSQTVEIVARNASGLADCSYMQPMNAGQYVAILAATQLPCMAGGEGFLDFIGQSAALTAVGFTAADEGLGAFTTFTPWGVLNTK